jgi:Galactose oxidase, central domain
MKIITQVLVFLTGASAAIAQSPGTFTATGNMIGARVYHTATLLNDGRVLITGGSVDSRSALDTAELYDPGTGSFTAAGSMTLGRSQHAATLLPNGKVLITGGTSGCSAPNGCSFLASAELYDSSTGIFSRAGDMTVARASHTATLLADGRVLIAGGAWGGASAELYDPSTGIFTATGNMTTFRVCPRAILLATGKVLVTEGAGCEENGSADLYDPGTGTFSATGGTPPAAATANLLTNGTVMFTFGDCAEVPSPNAALYDPSTQMFSATGSMAMGRCLAESAVLSDGRVLISGSWPLTSLGGACNDGARAELYDPASGKFTPTGDMTAGRYLHTTTLLSDGRVLIAGGVGVGRDPCRALLPASAELYNPPSVRPALALLSLSRDGQGQGAILHSATHQVVSPETPAVAGEVLEIYLTGLIDGSVIPPQVAVGGRMAEVLFFGNAPGFAGLNQVNVRVPNGVVSGPTVPVRLNYLGRPSNEVTIAVEGK